MIKVANNNGSPEYIPETTGGIHSDSDYFYFFNTKQEHDDFLASLPPQVVNTQPEVVDIPMLLSSQSPEQLAILAEQLKKLLNL